MVAQGVPVYVEMYGGMPHDFVLMMAESPPAQTCLANMATFLRESVEQPSAVMKSGAKILEINGQESDVQLEQLLPHMTFEEVKAGMDAQIQGWGSP